MKRIHLTVFLAALCLWLPTGLTAQDYVAPARKLQTALFAMGSLYVDEVDYDEMVESAIDAMVEKLDPHSEYMTMEEMRALNEPLQGGFDGIGISFNMMNDTLFVVEVISGGPSEKVGLQPGDRILKVDGENIAGVKMSSNEVMKRLKGPKGTTVRVSVVRRHMDREIEFDIVRDKIPLYTVEASFMVGKNIGYIKVSRFGATTLDEFKQAMAQLKKEGMTQLVLDLQSNGGGYMESAIQLADEFLEAGRCIVYTEGLHSQRTQFNAAAEGGFEKGNVVVLIDEYSASSSEIVTGALQDWDRALVIGRRSFGKGLVQRVLPLGDGSALKLTVSRYHTPSGRCIQKPYEGGSENYSRDLIERYNRGEMLSADSIHFPDSLKYATLLKQRTVYGGGGIMPDVFVPVDTTRVSRLHSLLINRGVLNRYTLTYVDEHREELKSQYPTDDKFVESFAVSDEMMAEMLALAESEKCEITDEMRQSDTQLIRLQTKAYIARDLYKTADYYKVMAGENDSLSEALRVLGDRKLRAQYGLQ